MLFFNPPPPPRSYVVGHELGHNMGAAHNVEKVGDKNWYRGYLMGNSTKRTMLAYNSFKRHGNRINYYSDDVETDPEGDRLGHERADNSQRLNDMRFLFDIYGDESEPCPADMPGPRCLGGQEGAGCCTEERPCRFGHGSCRRDSECAPGLVCGQDNCFQRFCLGVHHEDCPFDETDDCCVYSEGGIPISRPILQV